MNKQKQLGAKEMFKQSIIYLYNSYREEGYPADQAKQKVAKDIKDIYNDYHKQGAFPEVKWGTSNPKKVLDDMSRQLKEFDWSRFNQESDFGRSVLVKRLFQTLDNQIHQLRATFRK